MQEIRSCIESAAGLAPPQWILEARVSQRMQEMGIGAIEGYLVQLQSGQEIENLIELLRVGETSFFRHRAQIESLEQTVLPSFQATLSPVRVWSAGCASGEEAYSLSMLLSRALPGRQYTVLGSDISLASLSVAEKGEYTLKRDDIPREHSECFSPSLKTRSSRVSIVPHIRSHVSFAHQNLASDTFSGKFDLILCRNVLIYFGAKAKALVLEKLVAALKPRGVLFLGYSESLRGTNGLEVIGPKDSPVYRRISHSPKSASAPPARHRYPTTDAISDNGKKPVHTVRLQGDYSDSLRIAQELRSLPTLNGNRIEVCLDNVSYLGNEAAVEMRRAMEANPNLAFIATRPGHLRFLRRHKLLQPQESKS